VKNAPCFLLRDNSCNSCRARAPSCRENYCENVNQLFFLLQTRAQDAAADFAPQVTATCKAGAMNIKVLFNSPYSGAVHAKDHRTAACMTFGNGTSIVTMSLNLLAKQGSSEYCGILVSNVSSDVRSTNFAY
jgi:hypothetical protein